MNTQRLEWGQKVSRWAGCSKAQCPKVKLIVGTESLMIDCEEVLLVFEY